MLKNIWNFSNLKIGNLQNQFEFFYNYYPVVFILGLGFFNCPHYFKRSLGAEQFQNLFHATSEQENPSTLYWVFSTKELFILLNLYSPHCGPIRWGESFPAGHPFSLPIPIRHAIFSSSRRLMDSLHNACYFLGGGGRVNKKKKMKKTILKYLK